MAKLNQLIAVVNGKKSRVQAEVTRLYHQLQHLDAFYGLTKTYESKDDEGEQYPPDSKRLQANCNGLITEAVAAWSSLFEAVATQDRTNTLARANVVVDGQALFAEEVPAVHLIFLEKNLVDVRTFISKFPVLDPAREWHWSDTRGCWITDTVRRTKTKKVMRHDVIVPPTEHHPAQVAEYHEDVVEGHWAQVDTSGAVSQSRKQELLDRCDKLIDAIKSAREEANNTTVIEQDTGKPVFEYLFGPQT